MIRFGIRTFADRVSGRSGEKRLFILIYHRVLVETDPMRPGEVTVASFSWQMDLLKQYFNVLPLNGALAQLYRGDLPARAVSVTFDDGYRDNLSVALPILEQHGIPATVFIATGFLDGGRMWNDTVIELLRYWQKPTLDLRELGIGTLDVSTNEKKIAARDRIIGALKYLPPPTRNDRVEYLSSLSQRLPDDLMLSRTDVATLYRRGVGIGGHTVSHPILQSIDDEMARMELQSGKQQLEALISADVEIFAYPNGKRQTDYTDAHREMAAECGFSYAVSTNWGVACRHSDRYQVPRFTPWDQTPSRFLLRMLRMYRQCG